MRTDYEARAGAWQNMRIYYGMNSPGLLSTTPFRHTNCSSDACHPPVCMLCREYQLAHAIRLSTAISKAKGTKFTALQYLSSNALQVLQTACKRCGSTES